MKLYVEGGGDGKALQIECRRGFREFLEKAGLKGKMPAIAACGGRRFAYEDYCTAIANGEAAMLLVDSEAPIAPAHQTGKSDEWQPRQHLKASQGDGWDRPQGAREADCHLMVQCMESWFLADREKLKDFFGQGFRDNSPKGNTAKAITPSSCWRNSTLPRWSLPRPGRSALSTSSNRRWAHERSTQTPRARLGPCGMSRTQLPQRPGAPRTLS